MSNSTEQPKLRLSDFIEGFEYEVFIGYKWESVTCPQGFSRHQLQTAIDKGMVRPATKKCLSCKNVLSKKEMEEEECRVCHYYWGAFISPPQPVEEAAKEYADAIRGILWEHADSADDPESHWIYSSRFENVIAAIASQFRTNNEPSKEDGKVLDNIIHFLRHHDIESDYDWTRKKIADILSQPSPSSPVKQ